MISKTSLHKNPFLGLFFRANDELVFGPKNLDARLAALAENTLQAGYAGISLNESNLVGLFSAMNSSGCVLPSFAQENEIAAVRKCGLNVVLLSRHYACGNNVLCNDSGALLNPAISAADSKRISDALGVEVLHHESLTGTPTVGAMNVVTNKGLLAYNDTPEVELKKMTKFFKVGGTAGTGNMGVAFNGICVCANASGALVGDHTSGYEMQRIYEALFG